MENINKSEKKNFVNCNGNFMVITKVIEFLQLFMPVTLAKRITAMAFLAAGFLRYETGWIV